MAVGFWSASGYYYLPHGILTLGITPPIMRPSNRLADGNETMAKVYKTAGGYQFAGLSTTGMRLVNEFQRHYPHLCEPTQEPNLRFVRLGSPEQNLKLGKLIADVRAHDPEPHFQQLRDTWN